MTPPDEPADPLALGQAAAAQFGGQWQLDVCEQDSPTPDTAASCSHHEPTCHDEPTGAATHPPDRSHAPLVPTPESLQSALVKQDPPPKPEQLVEAMLFVGGHPLTAEVACATVRGLTPEQFETAIATLTKKYRDQQRPYMVEARTDGYTLAMRPAFRPLRERLFGGPREARLSQPALDVLAVIAYRQPVGKAEVDAIRGTDSGAVLRQLVRLGLIAVQHRAEATTREVRYGTTARFLQVFGLTSLDELPQLGDAQHL